MIYVREAEVTIVGNEAGVTCSIGIAKECITPEMHWLYSIVAGGGDIMRTTFSIEVKMDIGPDDQMAAMEEVVKVAGRMVFAQAVMLAGKRAPTIAIKADNSFIGEKELNAFDPEDFTAEQPK
jgi:hypothetical protein